MTHAPTTPPIDEPWLLTVSDPFAADYHPTFTGNGFFAARVPAAGQGFSAHPVETQFAVAGLFGLDEPFQVRVGGPAWTTLALACGEAAFDDAFCAAPDDRVGTIEDYRQTLDLATGAIETRARWITPAGDAFDVHYTVFADRADDRRGIVRLDVRALQRARIVVSDVLDARTTRLVDAIQPRRDEASGTIALVSQLHGTGLVSAVASTLRGPGEARDAVVSAGSIGQALAVELAPGETASFVSYVGVALSSRDDGPDARALVPAAAISASRDAAEAGVDAVRAANDAAWRELWGGDILVAGDDVLQRQVRASRFYLLASVSAQHPFSPSPAGLSSDGYGGHVFWDTETWMWPSLLLADPAIARAVLQYRADRVDEAEANAAAGGDAGVRFAWEAALDGAEHTPAVEFGETELHVISDVALACWQYFLATGDEAWLADTGARIITGAADFWCGRAVADDDGALHIAHVTPPDEWAQAHDDSAYTNVAAARVCEFALRVGEVLRREPNPVWSRLAEHASVTMDAARGIVREHADYAGERIKQADVVMLTYPWQHEQPAELTARNLDYYASKVTEWGGPSMTDAMHAIVSAELGRSEDALWYAYRSAAPFLRAPFEQFAEERDGGAFTFVTGAGGFLQIFLYGFTGLRLREDGIDLAPLLPGALEGLTVTGLHYRGSRYDIGIGRETTTVTVAEGPPLRVHAAGSAELVAAGTSLDIPTRASSDAGPERGLGRLLTRVAGAGAPVDEGRASAADTFFPPASFDIEAVEVFDSGDLTRIVATVAGEIANPWAGEGMSAHELHVYLIDADAAPASTPALAPMRAVTAAPWALAVVASGLRSGAPGPARAHGTGLYGPDGRLVHEVRVTVARRHEIVVEMPTAMLAGRRPAELGIAAAMLDVSRGLPGFGDAPATMPPARVASVFVPTGSSHVTDADGRTVLPVARDTAR